MSLCTTESIGRNRKRYTIDDSKAAILAVAVTFSVYVTLEAVSLFWHHSFFSLTKLLGAAAWVQSILCTTWSCDYDGGDVCSFLLELRCIGSTENLFWGVPFFHTRRKQVSYLLNLCGAVPYIFHGIVGNLVQSDTWS